MTRCMAVVGIALGLGLSPGGSLAVLGQAASAPETFTLQQFRERVLAKNQDLAARRLQTEISAWQLAGEKAAFEPEAVASGERGRTERENTVEQSIYQSSSLFVERYYKYSAGVEGLTPTGAKYWLGVNLNDRANNLTDVSHPEPYENEYQGFAGISLTQPLLRNAGKEAATAKIRLAGLERDAAQQNLRKQMMVLVSRAESAYWGLAFAQQQQRMRSESVAMAEAILKDNRERVAAGKMSDLEAVQAEAGVAARRSQQSDALQQVVAAANELRTFLSETATAGGVSVVATDSPEAKEVAPDFSTAMQRAIECHPDYLLQKKLIEQAQVRVAYAKNQHWPQLDLTTSYGLNGLGASSGDSLENVAENDFTVWSVSLELRVPLAGGKRSHSELVAARLRQRQALMDLKAIEIAINNALQTTISRILSLQEQVRNYHTVVEFNRQLLDSEVSRLAAGKSDSRRVLEIESDLMAARSAEVRSLVDYRDALLDFELAGGTVLQERSIEPAEGMTTPRGGDAGM